MINLDVGDVVFVEVIDVLSYGVNIRFFDKNGFIQVPELSWDAYGLQSRVPLMCKIGDVIKVKILSKTDDLFFASLKDITPELDPWGRNNLLAIEQKLEGEVVLVADYGYLIKLPNLIISMLPIKATNEPLRQRQVITVKVVSIDTVNKKVTLDRCSD